MNETKKKQTEDLIVMKAGGSLMDALPGIINILKESGRKILIVPGGGIFADCVRAIEADNDSAHWMAILGMEQYGYYISSLGVPATDDIEEKDFSNNATVLLPYKILKEKDPLPHSWDVTSDSIAAWVAYTLSADLVLLKSVDGLTSDSKVMNNVCTDLPCDEVDPFLIKYLLVKNINTWILNARKPEILQNFLSGGDFYGTHIHGSF
ncbi:MAG: uridylate kinase [Methanomicrobium sp.]|nr:uridylate kinase [Methanomicrobium sp.]